MMEDYIIVVLLFYLVAAEYNHEHTNSIKC